MFTFTRSVERVSIFTPLGIRFWDAALDRHVAEGLTVTAWPMAEPRAVSRAILTTSGVYAFHGLARMRALEYPADGQAAGSPPPAERFVVAVDDRAGRFVPLVFTVDVPYRGIFPTENGGSLGGCPPGFYLFASANRPATANLAVVRAELVDQHGKAAAHAVLAIEMPTGTTSYGIADEHGAVAVMFAYPSFPVEDAASPLRSPAAAREPPRWPLQVRARYQPAVHSIPPGAQRPDLATLFAQVPAGIVASPGALPAEGLATDLVFGSEAVLRTGIEPTLTISVA